MTTELTVDSNPFVLYRCGDCNARRWMSDGHIVAFDDVTAAMGRDSARGRRRRGPRVVHTKILQSTVQR